MYKLHTWCRACGHGKPSGPPGIKSVPAGEKLIPVMDLGLQPPANNFCGPDDERAGHAPLQVMFCPKCTLAQLSVVVKPEILYANYPYVTSKSATMQAHFSLLWQAVNLECKPESVVEIGSNDGDFLKYARANGATAVCGIDPAENLARTANESGIQTFCSVLDEPSANMARAAMPTVNLIMARHVFAHVDDWTGFVKCLDLIASRDTLVVIEVPYVLDLLEHCEFDTLYHEHLSYVGLRPLTFLLEGTPFRLHKVVKFPIHGGSLAIMLRRRDHDSQPDASVGVCLSHEKITQKDWNVFSVRASHLINELGTTVQELVEQGKRVVGYGASAKSSVWLNALGFTRKEIGFLCDSTPSKQYKTAPGSGIPVVDEGALLRELPDYAVCFAWNFRREILEKNQLWRDKGGRFIFPVPEVEIV